MFKKLILLFLVIVFSSSCSTLDSNIRVKSILKRVRLLEARVEFNSQLININSQKIDAIKMQLEKIKSRLARERKKMNSDSMLSSIPPASLVDNIAKRDVKGNKNLAKSSIAFISSNSVRGVKITNDNSSSNFSTNRNYKELYSEALNSYRDKNYNRSAGLFERFIENFKDTNLYDNSIYWLAYCYLHLGKRQKAVKLLRKLIKDFPFSSVDKGGKTDAAIFTLIKIFSKEGNKKEVEYYKKLLLHRFPHSVFVKRIEKKRR